VKLVCMIAAFLVLAGCGANGPQYSEQEFPARSITVNGERYGYRVYLPSNRAPGEKIPVMLYLHGSNRRGMDNQEQLGDLAENIKGYPERFSFIVVVPQCRADTFWTGPMTEQALAALDQAVQEFGGDPTRLYLAGYSMGGFGVWQAAITHPDKFAALVSVAGGVEPLGVVSASDQEILSPQVKAAAAAPDVYRAYAEALKAVPVWLVHGENDESVPTEQSRKLFAAFKAVGDNNANYFELPGVGHGSVVQAFQEPNLFEWLSKQKLVSK